MPEVPKLLVEVNNLPRIRKYNIIRNVRFETDGEKDFLCFVYTKQGHDWSVGFDASRSDFEEQVAELIIEENLCSHFHHDGSTEYETLSGESQKALAIAKIQMGVKKSIKEKLDKTLEQLKDDLTVLIDTTVDEAFKIGIQNEKIETL